MKKIFFTSFFAILVFTVSAQQIDKTLENFLLGKFPEYLPSHVAAHAKVVPVTKKDTKKTYYLFDTKTSTWSSGKLRIGDSVVVFNNKPFLTISQRLFVGDEISKQSNKTAATQKRSRERRPMNPQVVQVGAQIGQQVLSGVIWRMQTTRRY